jgi:membrane protein insertase Oxa1/YidC/SpoIIIJ
MTESKKSRAAQIADGLQAKMKAIAEKYPNQPMLEPKQPAEVERVLGINLTL